ncbi:hypothetical protein ACRAKI_10190 [Saccharothrix isguenensis]
MTGSPPLNAPAIGHAATRPLVASPHAQYSPASRWSVPLGSRDV